MRGSWFLNLLSIRKLRPVWSTLKRGVLGTGPLWSIFLSTLWLKKLKVGVDKILGELVDSGTPGKHFDGLTSQNSQSMISCKNNHQYMVTVRELDTFALK